MVNSEFCVKERVPNVSYLCVNVDLKHKLCQPERFTPGYVRRSGSAVIHVCRFMFHLQVLQISYHFQHLQVHQVQYHLQHLCTFKSNVTFLTFFIFGSVLVTFTTFRSSHLLYPGQISCQKGQSALLLFLKVLFHIASSHTLIQRQKKIDILFRRCSK